MEKIKIIAWNKVIILISIIMPLFGLARLLNLSKNTITDHIALLMIILGVGLYPLYLVICYLYGLFTKTKRSK